MSVPEWNGSATRSAAGSTYAQASRDRPRAAPASRRKPPSSAAMIATASAHSTSSLPDRSALTDEPGPSASRPGVRPNRTNHPAQTAATSASARSLAIILRPYISIG